LTTLVFKSCLINEETLILPLWLKERKFSACLQLIESDRLSNPQQWLDSKKLCGGIKVDKSGASVAYYNPQDLFRRLDSEDFIRKQSGFG
jgi:phage portal protein, lambda family